MRRQIRTRIWNQPDIKSLASAVGDAFRDVQTSINEQPDVAVREFRESYGTPFRISGLQSEPTCIELVRVRNAKTPETPIAGVGSMVQYVWRGVSLGAEVTSIQGLTPAPGVAYVFTFRITYARQAS